MSKITPQHIDLAANARELAKSLAATAGFAENEREREQIYKAIKTITALADLYDEYKNAIK